MAHIKRSGTICGIMLEGFKRNNSVKLFLNLDQTSFKDISYMELWRPFCLAVWNHLCNFGRGHYEEQFCEFILILG